MQQFKSNLNFNAVKTVYILNAERIIGKVGHCCMFAAIIESMSSNQSHVVSR